MEKIIDGKKYKIKDYLDSSEFRAIIKDSMDCFIKGQYISDEERLGDMIEGYIGNPACFYDEFCRALGDLCIEGFENDLHEKIFNLGMYEELILEIKNAKIAYNIANQNIDRYFNLSNILSQILNDIVNKIPDEGKLQELVKDLPENWNKVFEEYQSIITPKK